MKAIAAIIEPAPIDVEAITIEIDEVLAAERLADRQIAEHDRLSADHARLASEAREVRRRGRIRLGALLNRVRGAWPTRGPNARGWGEYLERRGLADSTARAYMDEAKDPEGFAAKRAKTSEPDNDQEPEDDSQYGAKPPAPVRAAEAEPPPFRRLGADDLIQMLGRLPPEEKARVLRAGKANVNGGSGEVSRGTWCTPKAIALAVGPWDLDPFSNPRSHVMAAARCMLENSGDGFGDGSGPGSYRVANRAAEYADANTRVWIQPDYQMVDDAVDHYKHTRFCALLRWSPDVKGWFARLWPRVAVVAFPRGERVAFEPPPGLEDKAGAGSPHSHALYYADERDVTDEVRAMCIVWRVDHSSDPATVTPIDPPPEAA